MGDIIACDLTLTHDGAGVSGAGAVHGEVMTLLHPGGTHTSVHLDLAGVTDPLTVRFLDEEDEITFEAPVITEYFDYIFTPCDMGTLAMDRIVVTTDAYPNGEFAGNPDCAAEDLDPALYLPGCETAFTLRLEEPLSDAMTALGIAVQMPHGWTLESLTATGAESQPGPTPNSVDILWVTPPTSFPYDIVLHMQPTGAPGSGALGARFLTYQVIFRTEFEAPSEGEGEGEGEGEPAYYGQAIYGPTTTVRYFVDQSGEGEGEGEGDDCQDFEENAGNLSEVDLTYIGTSWSNGVPEEDCWPPLECGAHTADRNVDLVIDLDELLRVIQFYNSLGYHCECPTEDNYAPGPGDESCEPHDADYWDGPDWVVSLDELLRIIQIYNSLGYHQDFTSEDGYAPGPGEVVEVGGTPLFTYELGDIDFCIMDVSDDGIKYEFRNRVANATSSIRFTRTQMASHPNLPSVNYLVTACPDGTYYSGAPGDGAPLEASLFLDNGKLCPDSGGNNTVTLTLFDPQVPTPPLLVLRLEITCSSSAFVSFQPIEL